MWARVERQSAFLDSFCMEIIVVRDVENESASDTGP